MAHLICIRTIPLKVSACNSGVWPPKNCYHPLSEDSVSTPLLNHSMIVLPPTGTRHKCQLCNVTLARLSKFSQSTCHIPVATAKAAHIIERNLPHKCQAQPRTGIRQAPKLLTTGAKSAKPPCPPTQSLPTQHPSLDLPHPVGPHLPLAPSSPPSAHRLRYNPMILHRA